MTAPIEVVIDELVLHGVDAATAPAVIDAFRQHLRDELSPSRSVPATTPADPGTTQPGTPDPEVLGRQLAAAVARAVRR